MTPGRHRSASPYTARWGTALDQQPVERIVFRLPAPEPYDFHEPVRCPYPRCGSQDVLLRQLVSKAVRDPFLRHVIARRYGCLRCGRTFRVYPSGIGPTQTSLRLRRLSLLLYLLGLSYAEVPRALAALGQPISKTSVYLIVRSTGISVPELRRRLRRVPLATGSGGNGRPCARWANRWLAVELYRDRGVADDGIVRVELFDRRELAVLLPWLEQVAAAAGAQMLVHRARAA